MHHSEHAFHNVTRVEAHEPSRLFQSNGSAFSMRRILIHDKDGISEIALFAAHEEALALRQPERPVEAMLKDLSVEQLDDLANAVRAERQSREPAPDAQDFPTAEAYGAALLDHEAKADDTPYAARLEASLAQAEIEARLAGGCPELHPRDCPGVTVTEDDGLPF